MNYLKCLWLTPVVLLSFCVIACSAQKVLWGDCIYLTGSIGVADELVYAFFEKQMLNQGKLQDAQGFFDHLPISTAIAQTKTPSNSGGFDLAIPRKAILKDHNLVIVAYSPFEQKDFRYWLVHIPEDDGIREVSLEDQVLYSTRQTAYLAGYEITFSANIPKITYSYIKKKQGLIQGASIYVPHGHTIEFIVNEHAPAATVPESWQTLAGIDYWPSSTGWKKTAAGIEEIAGLKFAISHWMGKQARTTYCGVDYIARDGRKLIGLRELSNGDELCKSSLAEPILRTLRR
jgi:hypothetical protein